MPATQRITGFIINQFNAKEADKVVHILASDGDKHPILIKGVKKSTSRKAHAIDLLNLVEVKAASGVQVPVADDVKLQNKFSAIKKNYKGLCFVQAVCELFTMQAQEGVEDTAIFELLNSTLPVVDPDNLDLMLAYIYLRMIKLSGNLPELSIDVITGDQIESAKNVYWQIPVGFTNDQSEQELLVSTAIYKSLRFLEICSGPQATQLSLNTQQQKQILKIVFSWAQQIYERALPAGSMALSAT